MNLALRLDLYKYGVYYEERSVKEKIFDTWKNKHKMLMRINCECGHVYDLEMSTLSLYRNVLSHKTSCPKCDNPTYVIESNIYITGDDAHEDLTKKYHHVTDDYINNLFLNLDIRDSYDIRRLKDTFASAVEDNNKVILSKFKYSNVNYKIYFEDNNLITEMTYDIDNLKYIFDLNTEYKDRHKIYHNNIELEMSNANIKLFDINTNACNCIRVDKGVILNYYKGNGVLLSTLIKRFKAMTVPMETLIKLDLIGHFKIPSYTEGGSSIKDLYEFLKMDKGTFKAICNYIKDKDCKLSTVCLKEIFNNFDHNKAINICEDIKHIEELSRIYILSNIIYLIKIGYSSKKLAEYLEGLMERQGIEFKVGLQILRDYVQLCTEMELPRYDRYPKSLKLYHDLAVIRFNLHKDKIANKKISFHSEKYMDLNGVTDGTYTVFVANSVAQLIQEGSDLGHCVGSYGNKVAEGRSVILFMRELSDVDKALITIELDPTDDLAIRQVSGQSNREATSEEMLFIDKTLKQAINELIKSKDFKASRKTA